MNEKNILSNQINVVVTKNCLKMKMTHASEVYDGICMSIV